MAVKCLELVEQVTLALHQNEDVLKALRFEDLVGRPVISIECFEDSL